MGYAPLEIEAKDEPVKDPLDVGFYYPLDYLITAWRDREKFGIFPNGLPFDEQDPQLLEDFATLDQRFDDIYTHLAENDEWLPDTMTLEIPNEPEEVEVVSIMRQLKRGDTFAASSIPND